MIQGQSRSVFKKLQSSFKMYDNCIQVVSSILVCGLLINIFKLVYKIWKVRTSILCKEACFSICDPTKSKWKYFEKLMELF